MVKLTSLKIKKGNSSRSDIPIFSRIGRNPPHGMPVPQPKYLKALAFEFFGHLQGSRMVPARKNQPFTLHESYYIVSNQNRCGCGGFSPAEIVRFAVLQKTP